MCDLLCVKKSLLPQPWAPWPYKSTSPSPQEMDCNLYTVSCMPPRRTNHYSHGPRLTKPRASSLSMTYFICLSCKIQMLPLSRMIIAVPKLYRLGLSVVLPYSTGAAAHARAQNLLVAVLFPISMRSVASLQQTLQALLLRRLACECPQ